MPPPVKKVKKLVLPPTVVIRAQIQKKNAQIVFFLAQVKMLSFKNMLRLRCSDRNKCSDENAQF